jgi:2-polyprenyl-6-methoxyphenol hydroxylase-like FAD-dependent oxidoreductase
MSASGERRQAVVIGGGPSGALSALALARRGWDALLVERGGRGRGKTCGHCLNPRSASALASFGLLDEVRAIAVGRTERLRVHLENGRRIEAAMGGREGSSRAGWLVERRGLDALLQDAAEASGVEIVRGESARLVCAGDGAREAVVSIGRGSSARRVRAALVVGADGLRSAVAARAGLSRGAGRVGKKFGFSLDAAWRDGHGASEGVVEMFVARGAYVGVVRQAGGVAHAAGLVGVAWEGERGPREVMAAFRTRFALFGSVVGEEMGEVEACGPMPCHAREVARGRVALVGDAAGYHEPFTGEGMAWAMESARALDEAAVGCLPGVWDARAGAAYARAWRRAVGRRQRACRGVAWLLERPGLLALFGARGDGRSSAPASALVRRVVAS